MEGGEGLGFFDYSTDGLVSGDWGVGSGERSASFFFRKEEIFCYKI